MTLVSLRGLRWLEIGFNLLLAVALIALVRHCFVSEPVLFTRLIAEDNLGENGTFVAFALAGLVLLGLGLRGGGPLLRRAVWLGVACGALLLAGEEISWGQRVLGISTPETLQQLNQQGEINLHNTGRIARLRLHHLASLALLAGVALSGLVEIVPRLAARLDALGVPRIPLRLAPLLLLPVVYFKLPPVIKGDEIGELLLAAALAVWAVDQWLELRPRRVGAALRGTATSLAVFALTALGAWVITARIPHAGMQEWLNLLAERDYPKVGMHAQSAQLYSYLDEHPEYRNDRTGLGHGKALLALGQEERADQVLLLAGELPIPADAGYPDRLRAHARRVEAYTLAQDTERADQAVRDLVSFGREAISAAPNPDEAARWLWYVARGLEGRQCYEAALAHAQEALARLESPAIRSHIQKWSYGVERRRQALSRQLPCTAGLPGLLDDEGG